MTPAPAVSVVMGVCNGAASLRETVRSVLVQEGVDFEFIVVDDGSTDATGALLDEWAASDARVRAVHQANQGLTRALIHGCGLARGAYIARQDCGDVSLPGRLRTELEMLQEDPSAAMASCATRVAGPEGELLYEVAIPEEDATRALLTSDPERVRGPFHGSTMFRRDLYERVGGYRDAFYFAQDLDLWTRLVDHGRHLSSQVVLYGADFAFGSISSLQRDRQMQCKAVILECCRLRRAGQSEEPALTRARAIVPERRTATPQDLAAAMYFVGSCLRARGDPRARRYFWNALRTYPLHIKSAARLLLEWLPY